MPENGGFPCAIDGLQVLWNRCWSVVADLMGVGNCASALEKTHIPLNQDAPGNIKIPCQTRRRAAELVATVCSCNGIRRF